MLTGPGFSHSNSEQAVRLFWQASKISWLRRLWAYFTHRPVKLVNLDETLCCTRVQQSHYAGVQTIRIGCIQGTQGKSDAFDAEFRPTKTVSRSRWVSIARENMAGHALPPVEIVDVNGVCYVRDGHHRISVARCLGQAYIDAEVTVLQLACRCMEYPDKK